jgi:apolipoprotein N-acyltransferase
MTVLNRSKRPAARRQRSLAPKATGRSRSAPPAGVSSRWLRDELALSLLSGVLLLAAFPPWNVWPLAWIAPIGWLAIIRRPSFVNRRPYLWIWIAAWVHWALLLYGISLAHPLLILGWLALSGYLAVYPVLFIGLSRVAVHRLSIPLPLVAPVVWVGLELARGYLISGFSAALLGHTQVAWIPLIQIADLFGGYAVSFVLMFTSACLLEAVRSASSARSWPTRLGWPLAAVLLLAVTLLYGNRRASVTPTAPVPLKVALIQNSVDTIFEYDEKKNEATFEKYWAQTLRVAARHPDLDLIVWPESMFTEDLPQLLRESVVQIPHDSKLRAEQYEERLDRLIDTYQQRLEYLARAVNAYGTAGTPQATWLLVGTETRHYGPHPEYRYNTALLISPEGKVAGHYYKIHRVLFGEYLPLGDQLPWIYRWTPLKQGLRAGEQPTAFSVKGQDLAPSICFESTVPHLIRWQLADLARQDEPVGILVNLTNDGWFWGSSILDLHLTCGIFRAVENRKPMLIAANTGISAAIDSNGRVLVRANKRHEDILLADVYGDYRTSLYQRLGDIPAGILLACCIPLAVLAWTGRGGGTSYAGATESSSSTPRQ